VLCTLHLLIKIKATNFIYFLNLKLRLWDSRILGIRDSGILVIVLSYGAASVLQATPGRSVGPSYSERNE
jgi:hypothetical protein